MLSIVKDLRPFFKDASSPLSIAIMAVDVQRIFCAVAPDSTGTDRTDDVALDIKPLVLKSKSTEAHRVCVQQKPKRRAFSERKDGLYGVSIEDFTLLHLKAEMNAFKETLAENDNALLSDRLKERGVSHIVAVGFYTDCCMRWTVESGLKDFNIAVPIDLTANQLDLGDAEEPNGLQDMQNAGAIITDAQTVHHAVQNNFYMG